MTNPFENDISDSLNLEKQMLEEPLKDEEIHSLKMNIQKVLISRLNTRFISCLTIDGFSFTSRKSPTNIEHLFRYLQHYLIDPHLYSSSYFNEILICYLLFDEIVEEDKIKMQIKEFINLGNEKIKTSEIGKGITIDEIKERILEFSEIEMTFQNESMKIRSKYFMQDFVNFYTKCMMLEN